MRLSAKGREYYTCPTCGFRSTRYLAIDRSRRIEGTSAGIRHFGAGAFVWRNGRILLLQRPRYPFAFAIPGGHMDERESPKKTLRREVWEETGLRLERPRLVYHDELPGDRCRKGGDRHVWWLYEDRGIGRVRGSDESRRLRWFRPSELRGVPLTYCTRYLLRKFGILKKEVKKRSHVR